MTPDTRQPGFGIPGAYDNNIRAREQSEVHHIQATSFSAEHYYTLFRLSDESLKGKRVLDIGAGASSFVPHLLHLGVDAYALDPRFVRGGFMRLADDVKAYNASRSNPEDHHEWEETIAAFIKSVAENPDRFVHGFATRLPWPTDHFDLVVSSQLHFKHLARKYDIFPVAMREAVRVATPGGKIKIYPASRVTPPFARAGVDLHQRLMASASSKIEIAGEINLTHDEGEILKSRNLATTLDELTSERLIDVPRFRKVSGEEDEYILEMTKRRK